MGAGTTLGEALKLGCTVVGSDINPISTFQVRKALEPVDPYELRTAFKRVENKVQPQIQYMYQSVDPETGGVADILYCFWIMVVECPQCREQVRLFETSIFAKNAYPQKVPVAQSVCLFCGQINATEYNAVYHVLCANQICLRDVEYGSTTLDIPVCSQGRDTSVPT